ncbi:hypothetical protein AAE02nite_38530 [Adhaeribacter aerolatus]|uniref:Uncharacterized protein n=1 Tax=Adhaeribacter aerolatus TaxID=670289 RepID=A0A512B2L4_9BACT|nr:hypothetical protein [Adhaeribacter aerolatus]GEO06189.1 hypothetical protein AAE02nite_38530 [Adhaeribacter aerolatus]
MLNFFSVLWGIITLLLAVISFIPLLGWGNWFVIPLAVVGAIIGAFSSKRSGLYLNIIALLLAMFRLMIGGGFI